MELNLSTEQSTLLSRKVHFESHNDWIQLWIPTNGNTTLPPDFYSCFSSFSFPHSSWLYRSFNLPMMMKRETRFMLTSNMGCFFPLLSFDLFLENKRKLLFNLLLTCLLACFLIFPLTYPSYSTLCLRPFIHRALVALCSPGPL